MGSIPYKILVLLTILRLTCVVALDPQGGARPPDYETLEVVQTNDLIEEQHIHDEKSEDLVVTPEMIPGEAVWGIIFLVFNFLFLGNAMHDWMGPPPAKPPPKGEEPYKITFEIGSDDTKTGRLDGAGGQQHVPLQLWSQSWGELFISQKIETLTEFRPNIHLYDDKAQEIGSNNDTTYLWENAMHRVDVKPNEYMGGKPPKYLTLMARGNNPICLTSIVVATPPPDGRAYGLAAVTPMSCGLKWASSGRENYHNLTSISYKPCFWFGAPFPEYLQVDLEFHTNRDSKAPWIEQLNQTGNEWFIHQKFCNTLKHFHVRDEWPPQPFQEAIITDDRYLGYNFEPLNQTVIAGNMVNKTGVRMKPSSMELGYL